MPDVWIVSARDPALRDNWKRKYNLTQWHLSRQPRLVTDPITGKPAYEYSLDSLTPHEQEVLIHHTMKTDAISHPQARKKLQNARLAYQVDRVEIHHHAQPVLL